jgi:L-fucono-1,5-lactonase
MMHIDSHQHFWIYHPKEYEWIDESMSAIRRNFLPDDLKPELEANGFDGSIVVQVRQTLDETRWLLELAEKHPTILGIVGWVDLCAADIRSQLQILTQNPKLVGIRHIAQSEPDDHFLVRPDFMHGIAMLEEFNLAYDILIYTKHLPVAFEFVQHFPRQRFVLDHLAKPPIRSGEIAFWADHIRRLAARPNVFCKLSGMVTEADWHHWTADQMTSYLDVAFQAFGPDRLMIGSDWPVCLVASSYSRTVQVVKDYILSQSPDCQNKVLGANAAAFWRLNQR